MAPHGDLEVWLRDAAPSDALPPALRALWWAKRGDWEQAHGLVQDAVGAEAAWVHAWLHRCEGDDGNAAYWYRRAGRAVSCDTLDSEWRSIAAVLSRAATPDSRPRAATEPSPTSPAKEY